VKPSGYDLQEASTEFPRNRIYWNEGRGFVLKFGAQNMHGDLKFVHEVPNWITLNWTMQNQIKACITNRHVRSLLF
jgi:hypothetical protein